MKKDEEEERRREENGDGSVSSKIDEQQRSRSTIHRERWQERTEKTRDAE
jgi:hypothetical protein